MDGTAWSGTAFGVDLIGSFPAPGIGIRRAGGHPGRSALLRLVAASELAPAFADPNGRTLYEQDLAGTLFCIRRHDEHGFLLHNDFYGRYRVAASGAEVDCVPSDIPDWLWQRFLVGQVLPLISLLHGFETLHASSVVMDGRALLFLGSSGAGKTSVALHLTGEGATLLSDDVTALELDGAAVLAHPGTSLASVDVEEVERLADTAPGRYELGISDGEARLVIDGVGEEPYPIAAVYVLTRRDDASSLSFTRLDTSPAAVLLGGTFNAYHRDGDRLVTQLEVCAALADTATLQRVDVPLGTGAAAVARAVADSFRSEAAA
jgi:hypothetical protein